LALKFPKVTWSANALPLAKVPAPTLFAVLRYQYLLLIFLRCQSTQNPYNQYSLINFFPYLMHKIFFCPKNVFTFDPDVVFWNKINCAKKRINSSTTFVYLKFLFFFERAERTSNLHLIIYFSRDFGWSVDWMWLIYGANTIYYQLSHNCRCTLATMWWALCSSIAPRQPTESWSMHGKLSVSFKLEFHTFFYL
jgi:hypothetical protein